MTHFQRLASRFAVAVVVAGLAVAVGEPANTNGPCTSAPSGYTKVRNANLRGTNGWWLNVSIEIYAAANRKFVSFRNHNTSPVSVFAVATALNGESDIEIGRTGSIRANAAWCSNIVTTRGVEGDVWTVNGAEVASPNFAVYYV